MQTIPTGALTFADYLQTLCLAFLGSVSSQLSANGPALLQPNRVINPNAEQIDLLEITHQYVIGIMGKNQRSETNQRLPNPNHKHLYKSLLRGLMPPKILISLLILFLSKLSIFSSKIVQSLKEKSSWVHLTCYPSQNGSCFTAADLRSVCQYVPNEPKQTLDQVVHQQQLNFTVTLQVLIILQCFSYHYTIQKQQHLSQTNRENYAALERNSLFDSYIQFFTFLFCMAHSVIALNCYGLLQGIVFTTSMIIFVLPLFLLMSECTVKKTKSCVVFFFFNTVMITAQY